MVSTIAFSNDVGNGSKTQLLSGSERIAATTFTVNSVGLCIFDNTILQVAIYRQILWYKMGSYCIQCRR